MGCFQAAFAGPALPAREHSTRFKSMSDPSLDSIMGARSSGVRLAAKDYLLNYCLGSSFSHKARNPRHAIFDGALLGMVARDSLPCLVYLYKWSKVDPRFGVGPPDTEDCLREIGNNLTDNTTDFASGCDSLRRHYVENPTSVSMVHTLPLMRDVKDEKCCSVVSRLAFLPPRKGISVNMFFFKTGGTFPRKAFPTIGEIGQKIVP